MYDAQTSHQIIAFGTELMQLFDSTDGTIVVTAERIDGTWTVKATGIDDVTAANRADAITALIDQALASLSGTGYSTLVPHGLPEMP